MIACGPDQGQISPILTPPVCLLPKLRYGRIISSGVFYNKRLGAKRNQSGRNCPMRRGPCRCPVSFNVVSVVKIGGMVMFRWIICIACATSFYASAQTYNSPPIDGLWWNPLESGRGWTIETQNDVTVVAHFTFAADGRSTFFTTSGTWNGFTRTLTSTLTGFTAGQCVGCAYVPPINSNLGEMRFVFSSTNRGSAIYPNGTTIPIQKFDFIYGDPRAYLKGQWASVWVSSTGSDFANFINFTANCSSCTTPNSVEGQLIYNRAGRPVLGAPVSGGGVYLIIVDSTTSFFDYYYVLPDSNRWTGVACTAMKSSPAPTISACLGLLFASRSKTQAAAGSAADQGSDKAIDESSRLEELGQKVLSGPELPEEFADIDQESVEALLHDIRTLQVSENP